MTNTSLIGFGGFKQCGKDAAADHLVWHHGWRKSFMSEPLKRASEALNAWMLIEREEWETLDLKAQRKLLTASYDNKGEFLRVGELIQVLGYEGAKRVREYRDHLQLLGTEVGRNIIDPDAWTNIAEREIRTASEEGVSTSLTGIRYRNELELIHRNGGITIWIERPEARERAKKDSHSSEWSLRPGDFDRIVENTGTLEELYAKIDTIVESL